ncbi:MAG TPA: patatin-like phospholipase family protein [Bacteroidia bacterium]|nr:patatin-like phospholipase family protein [Bacteroidia bacterium]
MSKYTRILSIDGGGIRGILPGQILVALEKKIQEKAQNPSARLADYFDFIAGTSTGGILTCIYLCPDDNNRPLFSAENAVNLYLQSGSGIFKSNLGKKIESFGGLRDEKYPAKTLEKLLLTYLRDIKLSQLLRPCIITSYDIFNRNTHFFTQHDAKAKPGYDYFLRDVARATSAAPTYFEPALIKSMSEVSYPLIDGGVFANNPALCAYAEVRQVFKNENTKKGITAKDMFMLSIGTGQVRKPYKYSKAKGWGSIGWVEPVLDIMMSGASDTVDFQLMQLFDAANVSENYIRIVPEFGMASSDMDDVKPENLIALKEAGTAASEKNDDVLNKAVEMLFS